MEATHASNPGKASAREDAALTALIKEKARALGFTRAGIARAEVWPESASLLDWLARGQAGTMDWMGRSRETRMDVRRLLPGARSVLCVAMSYQTARPLSTAPRERSRGWISRYAWGRDYHRVMEKRVRRLARALQRLRPGTLCATRVDTGPVLEHVAAAHAGVGWIGKNTCVIDRRAGSFLFLGEIVTDAPLVPDRREPDHCGTCRRCIDACPTGAIVAPYQLDARRCIAYLTIEHHGEIDPALRAGMGTHVYGCDICQDVCPWNSDAPAGGIEDFEPRPGAEAPELGALLERIQSDYEGFIQGTAMRRAERAGWLRNIAIAMGNSGERRFERALARLAEDPDAVVSRHARWALDRLRDVAGNGASGEKPPPGFSHRF
ncbi:MAG: tRNA epoxyqueuosine(34) reductase QueG [Deltaproteobacteria bacterium]|nr:tRNA epoxyqueuosine(34) reductase QueG [Deltaproteobacteria bacterium]